MLGVIIGLVTLLLPGVTAYLLLKFVAAWAVIGGVLRIVVAIRLRKLIHGDWVLAGGVVLSVLFGALLLLVPHAGTVSIAWLIGFLGDCLWRFVRAARTAPAGCRII